MGKQPRRKTGKPRAVEVADEAEQTRQEHPLEEFVKNMHGQPDVPQGGMPSLDWLKKQFSTKSAAVRYLLNAGYSVNDIHKHMGMRYQHVRNISKLELKRGPNEDWRKPYLSGEVKPPENQTQTKPKTVDD
jgi:hypothetical protein